MAPVGSHRIWWDLVGSGIQWVPVLVATGRYWWVLVVDFVDFVVPLGNSFILPDAMAKWGEGISFNRSGLRFEIECGDSERKKKYHQMWEARHTRPCARGVVNVAMFRFPQLDLGVSM